MARGGNRQGTPGVAYPNRTDLAADYAPQTGSTTAAAGGQEPVPTQPPPGMGSPGPVYSLTPDQVPRLDDPSQRPEEPVTAGLGGPVPGAESAPALRELRQRNLAMLDWMNTRDDLPERVSRFVRHVRSLG